MFWFRGPVALWCRAFFGILLRLWRFAPRHRPSSISRFITQAMTYADSLLLGFFRATIRFWAANNGLHRFKDIFRDFNAAGRWARRRGGYLR